MNASEWGYTYIVAWHPDGRWQGWFHDRQRDKWVSAARGRNAYAGNSHQLHRPALVVPPLQGGTAR